MGLSHSTHIHSSPLFIFSFAQTDVLMYGAICLDNMQNKVCHRIFVHVAIIKQYWDLSIGIKALVRFGWKWEVREKAVVCEDNGIIFQVDTMLAELKRRGEVII